MTDSQHHNNDSRPRGNDTPYTPAPINDDTMHHIAQLLAVLTEMGVDIEIVTGSLGQGGCDTAPLSASKASGHSCSGVNMVDNSCGNGTEYAPAQRLRDNIAEVWRW